MYGCTCIITPFWKTESRLRQSAKSAVTYFLSAIKAMLLK